MDVPEGSLPGFFHGLDVAAAAGGFLAGHAAAGAGYHAHAAAQSLFHVSITRETA